MLRRNAIEDGDLMDCFGTYPSRGWRAHAISMPNDPFIEYTQMDNHVFMLYPLTMDVHSSIFK